MRHRTMVFLCWLPLVACGGGTAATAQTRNRAPEAPGVSASVRFDGHLLVDQFGYRPGDPKVAVVRSPQVGYDHADKFSPGKTYQVRRTSDGDVVLTGTLQQWTGAEKETIEGSSGDQGWLFDFSALNSPGSYFVYDPLRKVRSADFQIAPDVYSRILRAAVRMFYYQRSGIAKRAPYADACWTDQPAYAGPGQDLDAHDIADPYNPAKGRDVSGGWFDAGDTNKYVTFAAQPVHQLLTAYQQNPGAFTDNFGIPESGNGIPDVLDEVKWETDWLKKMQNPDGSAALKVGETVYASAAPPSSDQSARFYISTCSSSTIAVASMFAHASLVFAGVPALAAESQELKRRAVAAWDNFQSLTTKQDHCDTGVIHAGNADWEIPKQNAEAVVAAVYLFAITDASVYDDFVKAHYKELRPFKDFGWTRYEPEHGEALLFYTTLPHADPALKRQLLDAKRMDMTSNDVYRLGDQDLYQAFINDPQYHWGSNNPRAQYGNSNMDVVTYHLDDANDSAYRARALGILHYFHGVNPFAMVYLSNMYALGATRSANEIYHTWFASGTKWSDAITSECGPAPGYVPGGPNQGAAASGVPTRLSPPTGQPPQKSYRDWNGAWPEDSWAITEPAIYYQSAYVELLSKFVP